MKDQPKPATGCTHPADHVCPMCKPASGEWTVSLSTDHFAKLTVGDGFYLFAKCDLQTLQQVANAHNAALADRNDHCMKFWLRQQERHKEQLAAEKERYETERQAHYGYVQLAEQHLKECEAQLSAERRDHTERMNSVQDFYSRQLAAERRKATS